ncbi:N-formylglutamate amidohydrolase [Sulfitobacter sp. F26169L]|uniref:N-formylglutamate amidohydrolase n=1 Tax=Sulfitobacter sp. F26169L TaxID=2996015 RepID=UPI002260B893|nr:N-formylglutamate amidohydrolase [Sulfitobacter sp. F26169L]MCX7567938.1 N-formylglutamate amidohydrolase [Sulfitobacter sp. F26169L]
MQSKSPDNAVEVVNPDGVSPVVLVCEHASSFIPSRFGGLGLSDAARKSHVAWDPGAMAVARQLAGHLNGTLVASTVSRLVYDCNRPPSSPGAMPVRSELTDIPGNADLSDLERADRIALYYAPFRDRLAQVVGNTKDPVIVTIHSFTPVYHGRRRSVEIGVLCDVDTRLADAMMQVAQAHTSLNVEVNQPYGPQDGVTHTLKEHALDAGHLNVMIEIRNDLIAQADQQTTMARDLAAWLVDALSALNVKVDATC